MRNKFLALAFLFACIITACDSDDAIKANGAIISETRAVADFTSISSHIPGNIFITQGSNQSLRIETHENIHTIITTIVNNGTLEIRTTENIRDLDRFDVHITIPVVEGVELVGAGNIESRNCLDMVSLNLSITGSGNITLCGTVDDLTLDITGSGNYRGYELVSNNCTMTISGAGNIQTTCNGELNVTISGAGNVFYRGNPNVITSISGTGSVIDTN